MTATDGKFLVRVREHNVVLEELRLEYDTEPSSL